MLFFRLLLIRISKLNNGVLFAAATVFILISSFLIYFLEPETFGSPFNGLWWVMTTVTTVGYGDFYPHSTIGKCLGMLLFIVGISLISIVISKAADTIFSYNRKKEEGKLRYKGQNHFVMIDWSKQANLAIQEILKSDAHIEVVLIDNMEKTPIVHDRVHYIQGNPVHAGTLELANLSEAKAVFIFGNEFPTSDSLLQDTAYVDGKTLLIATAIERNFKQVYTIVEIKDQTNIPNFTHVNVDEFILGSETVSQMAVRAAFNPGASKIMSQLLTMTPEGADLFEIPKRPHWVTYRDAFEELLREGATLISEGEQLNINRRLDEMIAANARLFVICDKETFTRLQAAAR
jgi:voltage-gated potassium channel